MFEKYNLIHFEAAEGLEPDGAGPHAGAAKASGALRDASYRITGSLDFLPPCIQKPETDEAAEGGLFLQSFCLMDSAPGYFTSRANYESLLLCYTCSGEGSLTYRGKTHPIEAGVGFVLDCREQHDYRCAGVRWQHVDVHLWGTQAEMLERCFRRLGVVVFPCPSAAMSQLLEGVLDAYTTPSPLRALYVGSALSNLLCTVLKRAEADAGVPPTWQSMVRYMEGHYTRPLSLDTLAERFHVSKFHMSREFRKYTGYSPGDYLISLRVRHALILLTQSDLSVEEIALRSGFGNLSNFIRHIKKRTGMTPSEFRRQRVNEV